MALLHIMKQEIQINVTTMFKLIIRMTTVQTLMDIRSEKYQVCFTYIRLAEHLVKQSRAQNNSH